MGNAREGCDNKRATGEDAEYARATPDAASRHVGGPTPVSRRFVIFAGGALVVLLVPLFISLGQWQWNKAMIKESRQSLLDSRAAETPVSLASSMVDADALRFRRVAVRGTYEPQQQILVDNRVHQERAGYHVVTPLRIEGSDMRVLVNRGWIPANADHSKVPVFPTPTGMVELTATAIVPGTRFFTLAPEPATPGWQPVWQNLDLARFRNAVTFPLQPVVLQLDAGTSNAGGFVRDWPRPDERIERHLGYAWQWFGFAAATAGIWIFFLLRPLLQKRKVHA
ncbi:MAG: SURF1 family protein [Zoogloeaceae bacterium]|nr:SURF1 family protein [Zoogloeaceae bacterium]